VLFATDDGSTDESLAILRRFQEKEEHHKTIEDGPSWIRTDVGKWQHEEHGGFLRASWRRRGGKVKAPPRVEGERDSPYYREAVHLEQRSRSA